uniref:SKP1 component POZ domain-containing protein n=1 Tax=Spongospora subterranea TaxID=70186 RepID=A0A0H5R424_9EUKA|eukprot:CRZ08888.1 hypothetical protein [Spongospora subterranea]
MVEDKGIAGDDIKGLDEDMADDMLRLTSQDKQVFEVERSVALMSELVKTILESDKDETNIPLPNVKGAILEKVIKYMRYHNGNPAKEIEKPLKSNNMREVRGSGLISLKIFFLKLFWQLTT